MLLNLALLVVVVSLVYGAWQTGYDRGWDKGSRTRRPEGRRPQQRRPQP